MPSPPENKISEKTLTKDNSIQAKAVEELKAKLCTKDLVTDPSSLPKAPASEPLPQVRDVVVEMIPEAPVSGVRLPPPPPPLLTEDGLILPRKPANPCLESADRLNLHRELMFNQKIGKNVLNQKSELQKALEKHKDQQAKKELEQQLTQATPELEKVIAGRAKRLQDVPTQNEDDKGLNKEFLQARAKLRTRNDSK